MQTISYVEVVEQYLRVVDPELHERLVTGKTPPQNAWVVITSRAVRNLRVMNAQIQSSRPGS